MPIAELDTCFSTMKRIKTFLRRTVFEKHLSALCMLSAGKLESSSNFSEEVTEACVLCKERRMDFTYK
jgi:hypothetical protein